MQTGRIYLKLNALGDFFSLFFIYLTTILLHTIAWLVQFCRVTSSFQKYNRRKLQQA